MTLSVELFPILKNFSFPLISLPAFTDARLSVKLFQAGWKTIQIAKGLALATVMSSDCNSTNKFATGYISGIRVMRVAPFESVFYTQIAIKKLTKWIDFSIFKKQFSYTMKAR